MGKNLNKKSKLRLTTLQKTISIVTTASLILPNIFGTSVALADTAETPASEIAAETPAQVATGITQDNLVYENGRVSLVNQEPGTNIAAVLPNGTVIFQTVPYHGTWQPLQTISTKKAYPGDTLEIFTYSGSERNESTFLTVEGEGEERPADQQEVRYGRQHFGFRPTERDSRVTYSTEPFFTVEMTFPDGTVSTQTADVLGRTSFSFPDSYTPVPGDEFSVQIYDRAGELLDVDNPDLFRNLTTPNQTTTTIYGEVPPQPTVYSVTINPDGVPMNESRRVNEVKEGESYTLPHTYQFEFDYPGFDLEGFTVDGTLLDADGNEVSEIPAFSREYTPMSDVTLTPIWDVTTGDFTISIGNTDVEPEAYTIVLTSEDGTTYELPYENTTTSSAGPISHNYSDEAFPYGTYTLSIEGYRITEADIRGWQMRTQPELNDDGTATVYLQFPENYPRNHATLDIEVEPIAETYSIGVEVKGLDGRRTDDVTIYVQNEEGTVFEGSFNEYKQWLTDEAVPVGEYTITLDTPANTYAVINDTTQQYAATTDQPNVFTLEVNEENLGSLSAVYGAFQLEEMTYPLGVEVRGLDGRRTSDVGVTVTNEEGEVFAGSFNAYSQWLTEEELPAGEYTITLDTPENTIAEINDTTDQYAVATDENNVFTIELNESNLGSSSAIYGAFVLVEERKGPANPNAGFNRSYRSDNWNRSHRSNNGNGNGPNNSNNGNGNGPNNSNNPHNR